jgi:cytochrome c5
MKKIVVVGFSLMAFMACQHEPVIDSIIDNGNGGDPTPTNSCDADTAYFGNAVLPLLVSNCTTSKCHDDSSPAEGVNLTTYSTIISTAGVRPGSHSNSKLYKVLVDNGEDRMPPTGALSAADIALIAKWIDQGAKNNMCVESTCNTDNVTFAVDVMPVINSYCTSCHSGTSPSGNTVLNNYATVSAAATSGKLLGTIKHATGYPIMPPSGGLTDCQISKIETWINNGKPNN